MTENYDSILNSVKKNLGIAADYDAFDPDLIMAINTCLSVCTQLGVGPEEGFSITGDSETWDDFISDWSKFGMVKSYVYIKTKLIFDPPVGSALESYKELANEFEWRANVQAES